MIYLKQKFKLTEEDKLSLWKALLISRNHCEDFCVAFLCCCGIVLAFVATVWLVAYMIAHWPVIA